MPYTLPYIILCHAYAHIVALAIDQLYYVLCMHTLDYSKLFAYTMLQNPLIRATYLPL